MLGRPDVRLIRRETLGNAGNLIEPSRYLALAYVGEGFDFGSHFTEEFRRGVVGANPATLYYTSKVFGNNLLGPEQHVVGNVVSILDVPDNLHPGRFGELAQVCETMRDLCDILGAQYWTGLGRIPAMIARSHTPVDDKFISGAIGSRTTVRLSLEHLLSQENIQPHEIVLGVLGAGGELGSGVARSARDRGFRVIGYDIQFRREQSGRNILLTNDPRRLGECRVLMNAASEGEALLTVLEYLRRGVLVLDDTYPRPSRNTIQQVLAIGKLFWAGVQREGVYLVPPFPGRVPQEIAGCLLETIVSVLVGFRISSPQRFYEIARRLGFEALPQEVGP